MGSKKKLVTFEMFKPNMKSGRIIFDIKSIGDSGKDKLTGLQDKKMSDVSIFIDDSSSSVANGYKVVCDLTNASMPGFSTNYYGANLNGANLKGADFSPEYGWTSNLSNVQMNGANLEGACLCWAWMSDGKLELNGANLTNADFTGVDLSNAELSGATWGNTTCPDTSTNTRDLPCSQETIDNRIIRQNGQNDYECQCG